MMGLLFDPEAVEQLCAMKKGWKKNFLRNL